MNEQFRKMIQEIAKRQVPVQTRWAKVVATDKEAGTMTAQSLETEVQYYDVQIGTAYKQVPKSGSRVLLGIVENKAAATFLLMATELEEVELTAEQILLNGDGHGGLIIFQKLFDELEKMSKRINGLERMFEPTATWVGTAKGYGILVDTDVAANITPNVKEKFDKNLINDTVKHGG